MTMCKFNEKETGHFSSLRYIVLFIIHVIVDAGKETISATVKLKKKMLMD